MSLLKKLPVVLAVLWMGLVLAACGGLTPSGTNAKANKPLPETLVSRLTAIGSTPGAPMMIRIFKDSSELEVWKQTKAGDYKLAKTYAICTWSGALGPKIAEGDRQSPEGFYTITPAQLNPNSSYYLSFNTGFPNKFDRAYGRTGSNLMVHGDCSSVGCFAMTDTQISEIYGLARETLKGGNKSFQLQIFPFRMTAQNLAKVASSEHLPFWKNIKEGYDRFELTRRPPVWDVCEKRYVFDMAAKSGVQLVATGACPAMTGDAKLVAALAKKQAVDDQVFASTVETLEQRAAREAAEAASAAQADADAEAEKAAIIARNAAIGTFVGDLFGGKEAEIKGVINPALVAPVPFPRLKRG